MRLVLVRHGETAANVRRALDTRPPGPPLNDTGLQQAQRLAVELGAEPIAAVYASTALRAQQTAEPLATKLGLAVQVVEGAQEIAAGETEGSTDMEQILRYHAMCTSWTRGELDATLPGAQTGHEFIARYGAALESLRDRHANETAVLVSHGAAIRIGAAIIAENLNPETVGPALLPNTAKVLLDSTPTGWRCASWPA